MIRPKILVVGDAVAPTGYARVIRAIFTPLHETFDVVHLATRFEGGVHDYPWRLIPASSGADPYGWDVLPALVDDVRPDLVFLLYDLGYQAPYIARIEAAGWRPRTVVYSPIEGGPIEPELLQPLRGVARYVVFTEAARTIVREGLNAGSWSGDPGAFADVEVIPHGVDTIRFHPMAGLDGEARRAGRAVLGLDSTDEAFIVLNANRNLPKKRLDLTIEGFAEFARGKPEGVKLFLHTAVEGHGWNVTVLARRHGVADRLILSSADGSAPSASDAVLNAVYNAADVGINTSNSEGWGLVSFEHAATRSAQILPGTPCLRSLWGEAATFLPARAHMTYPGDLTTGVVVSPHDLAASLERLYGDPALRSVMAERAYERAHDPLLRWPAIATRWSELFHAVLGQEPGATSP